MAKLLSQVIIRRMSSLAESLPKLTRGTYPVPNKPGYKKLMENQALFSRDDGLLVCQKKPSDMMLYRGICVAVGICFIMTLDALRQLATPPKNA